MSNERYREVPIRVAAWSGSRGEEEPRRFELEGRELEVAEILERWREPHGRAFRVRADDGRSYLLFCQEPELRWWLMGRSERDPGAPPP